MQKRAPTIGNLLVIVLFVLSCFALLLFLWESFGGSVPLKPRGYRFTVAFPRTLALAEQSDVRISGVDVGHVISLKLDKDGRTHATIEIDHQYAPLRSDVHAILRQKTLLGQTYVQIIPESKTAPFLADGSQLPNAQVEPSVTFDDILSLFDHKTRRAWQVWMQSQAAAFEGRGEDINAYLATLEPWAEHTNELLSILASQEGALRGLVRNTGVVFNALAGRDHELEGYITNGERTFAALAASSQEWADAFRAFPTFEHNSSVALRTVDSFSLDVDPLYDQLRPAERQLSSLLEAVKPFAPQFDSFLTALGPLTKAAQTGLPVLPKTLNSTVPILENLNPVLHNLDPFLQYTGEYVPEVQAFFANLMAVTQAHQKNADDESSSLFQHYLRIMNVISPQTLAVLSQRTGTDRANPYFQPGALNSLASGLPVFNSSTCANSAPSVSGPPNATVSQSIIEQLIELHVANSPGSPNAVAAPPCNQQGPSSFNGQSSQFPHVVYGGK